jgi:diacylglycerol kinase family enzyme
MRVTLVHNPASGAGTAPDPETLVRLCREAGHHVFYQPVGEEGWSKALERPADLVVAAGGDGTVGRVARRMVGNRVPMTALSLGTANNIARSLGLVDIALPDQIAGWHAARRRAIDAGAATGGWGRRVFIEGAGIGLFTSLMAEHDRRGPRRPASAQGAVTTALGALRDHLRHQRAKPIHASLDGRDVSGEYLLFEVMNMQFVGPNLYLAPDGQPGDGLLDVVAVLRSQRRDFDDYLAAWEAGQLSPPRLPTFQGRDLRISPGRHLLHVDDWVAPVDARTPDLTQSAIALSVLPGAVGFLMP